MSSYKITEGELSIKGPDGKWRPIGHGVFMGTPRGRSSKEMRDEITRRLEAGEPLGAFHNATITPGVFTRGTLITKEQMDAQYSRGPLKK